MPPDPTHSDMVALGHRWLTSRGHTAFTEFTTMANESPDVIGWKAGQSTLIECKASRSDFLADKNKLVRKHPWMGLGRQRFYLCPWGVIAQGELPERWGLMWARGNRVYVQVKATPFPEYDLRGELVFLNSMVRRANIRLANQHLSDWLRWENRHDKLEEL